MKDLAIRAAKTFIQAAIGYVCALSLVDTDWANKTVVAGVVISAVAAGLSALMNIDWETAGKEEVAAAIAEPVGEENKEEMRK